MSIVYKYRFGPDAHIEEIQASLLLALVSTESLHGEVQTRVDAAHYLDERRRQCVIDATTEVGQSLNKLFAGYVRREFGEDSFQVERIDRMPEKEAPRRRHAPTDSKDFAHVD